MSRPRRLIEETDVETVRHAAARIGVSPKTVRSWTYSRRGKPARLMPYATVGRRLLLVCAEVDECAAELGPHERGELSDEKIREMVAAGEVMTSAEVATLLGVSRTTVRTMTYKNRLRPLRRNTRPLVFASEPIWDLMFVNHSDLARAALAFRESMGNARDQVPHAQKDPGDR